MNPGTDQQPSSEPLTRDETLWLAEFYPEHEPPPSAAVRVSVWLFCAAFCVAVWFGAFWLVWSVARLVARLFS